MPIEVSIVMPNFNRSAFLQAAVRSVLNEKISGLELIVVDDGSTDNSCELLQKFSVKTIQLGENRGQAHAMNVGVKASQGQFIGFVDSDDILAEGGIRWRADWLKQNPLVRVIAGSVAGVIDTDGEPLGSYQEVINPKYRIPSSPLTFEKIKSGQCFPTPAWLFLYRREVLESVGEFDETLKAAHDGDYFLRVLRQGPIDFLDKPVAYYRIHENNLSGCRIGNNVIARPEAMAENIFVHLRHGIST